MSDAKDLFDKVRSFKTVREGEQSPQCRLIEYCKQVLGGVEGVHFDFKSKANPAIAAFEESDRKNLAKAISGFANGGGGVLIWGITDKSIAPVPIVNVSRFVDEMLQLSHQITSPTVPGIDGDFISADENTTSGFALLFVPESDLPPHRVILKVQGIQNHYYVRSGSSFSISTHSQLEDMFGRRPRPVLTVETELDPRTSSSEMWIIVSLENKGRGIAKYPFLSIEVGRPFGLSEHGIDGNGGFGLPLIRQGNGFNCRNWTLYGSMDFGSQDGFAIHSGMRHPITKIVQLGVNNATIVERDISIRFRVAADGLPMKEYNRVITERELVISTIS